MNDEPLTEGDKLILVSEYTLRGSPLFLNDKARIVKVGEIATCLRGDGSIVSVTWDAHPELSARIIDRECLELAVDDDDISSAIESIQASWKERS
jgi:hypothetical protein